jgi:hypothetical protein
MVAAYEAEREFSDECSSTYPISASRRQLPSGWGVIVNPSHRRPQPLLPRHGAARDGLWHNPLSLLMRVWGASPSSCLTPGGGGSRRRAHGELGWSMVDLTVTGSKRRAGSRRRAPASCVVSWWRSLCLCTVDSRWRSRHSYLVVSGGGLCAQAWRPPVDGAALMCGELRGGFGAHGQPV